MSILVHRYQLVAKPPNRKVSTTTQMSIPVINVKGLEIVCLQLQNFIEVPENSMDLYMVFNIGGIQKLR